MTVPHHARILLSTNSRLYECNLCSQYCKHEITNIVTKRSERYRRRREWLGILGATASVAPPGQYASIGSSPQVRGKHLGIPKKHNYANRPTCSHLSPKAAESRGITPAAPMTRWTFARTFLVWPHNQLKSLIIHRSPVLTIGLEFQSLLIIGCEHHNGTSITDIVKYLFPQQFSHARRYFAHIHAWRYFKQPACKVPAYFGRSSSQYNDDHHASPTIPQIRTRRRSCARHWNTLQLPPRSA